MSEDETTLGQTLRKARETRRMTQAHLAQAAGVSARTVMRAENGDDVSPESLRALCSVLLLDAEALASPEPASPTPSVPPCAPASLRLASAGAWAAANPFKATTLGFGTLAALGLVAFLAINVVMGLALPSAYARHISWSSSVGMRKALALVGPLSQPMDALAGDSEPPATLAASDWSVEQDEPWRILDRDCEDPGFWAFVKDEGRTCRPWSGGVRIRVSDATRFEATVGPLQGRPLAMLARLLTPNPRLRVSVAFGDAPTPPATGLLWLDPRRLADDQVPQHPGRAVYMHLVTTLAEPAR